MKIRSIKKIAFFIIALAVVIGITFLIIFLNKQLTENKIRELKSSTITYLGKDDNGNYVHMGSDGKTYIYSGYTSMQEFSYDTANVRKDGLEGVISKNNKILVDFGKYYDISDERFCGSYIVQNESNKYGLISYDGKVILDTVYDNITTFGADTPVFKLVYENKYYIATVNKAIIYETSNSNVTIQFGEKLNKDTDKGLVKIIDEEIELILDIDSGKQVYTGKNLEVGYNIIKDKENNRFILVDEQANIVKKVDYIASEEKLDIKFDKYIVIESKAGYFEIYNKKMEKVLETERKPIFFQNYKKETFIINNTQTGVEIYKGNEFYKSISGYEYVNDNMVEYGVMFALKNTETEKMDLFNFELNKLKEDILLDKIYPKYVLLVDAESNKYIYTNAKEEIKLGNNISMHALNTNSTFNEYVLVSKANNDIYDMLDLKGNSVIKNIAKVEVLLDDYVIITDNSKNDMYLFNVKTNKEIFRFEKDKYDSSYEKVQTIKLTSGYFNYKGEQIAKIDE